MEFNDNELSEKAGLFAGIGTAIFLALVYYYTDFFNFSIL